MGTILKHLPTGKLVRFILSIPSLGAGAVHLLEDMETGLVRVEQELSNYQISDNQSLTSPWDTDDKSANVEPQAKAVPAPASPQQPDLPPEPGAGLPPEVQGPQSAPQGVGPRPGLPATGA